MQCCIIILARIAEMAPVFITSEDPGLTLRLFLLEHIVLRPKKHFKNEQRSRDAAAKKRANTSAVGKINNYCEDIYIPRYNTTH